MSYVSSTRGSSFRWPFYAQILSEDKVNIMFMHKPLVSIGYKHPVSKYGVIERICFSNRGNLIM